MEEILFWFDIFTFVLCANKGKGAAHLLDFLLCHSIFSYFSVNGYNRKDFYLSIMQDLYATLRKFKMSESELCIVNHFSLYKRVPKIAFYYKMFESLLSDVEKSFKPHVSYRENGSLKVDAYIYEFWLGKTAQLYIRKQKDFGKWRWLVLFCGSFYDCTLFTTSAHSQSYGSRLGWDDKKDLNYEIEDDVKERCKLAFDKIFSVYKTIKDSYAEYVELLNSKLISYRKRRGIIPRKTFIEQNRKLPEEYQDRVCAWLDDAANAGVIRKCLKFLKTPIEYMDKVPTRQFYETCKAYYQANPDWFKAGQFLKEKPKASAKDWYRQFADGRDDGLADVDEDSYEDYLEWAAGRGKFRFNGHHPWKIECGRMVSLDAHLFVRNEAGKGYYFALSFHALRVPELVKGYVRMRKLGVPVCVYDAEKLEKMLLCEDCIGILEEHGDIVHGSGLNTFDYRLLPDKSAGFVRKIRWEAVRWNEKLY